MRTIRYGFFGEDDAQRLFLHHYLTTLAKGKEWQFAIDPDFHLVGGNKSRVKAQFDEACEVSLTQYRHDCCFVGLDLDDHDVAVFNETVADMQRRLQAREIAALLLVPVQCIEHWLRYLQWHAENPQSTKNVTLETEERRMAKTKLYGSPKTSTRHSNPIVERTAANMDIDWLASRSISFLAFHKQVQEYIISEGLSL